jgi:hypothetical protein
LFSRLGWATKGLGAFSFYQHLTFLIFCSQRSGARASAFLIRSREMAVTVHESLQSRLRERLFRISKQTVFAN